VEPGELPGAALARELREELGIDIAVPTGPPMQEVRADTFDMQIWLVEAWAGSPANAAPDEHDAIAWFTKDALGELCLAHDSYLWMFSKVLPQIEPDHDRARALIGIKQFRLLDGAALRHSG
jgi:8-oxo-dGTP diphosphatase